MQFMTKRAFIHLLLAFILLVVSGIFATKAVKAQDGVNVTIKGTLQAVNGDGTIVVNGATYKLGDGVVLPSSAQVGTVGKLTGHFVNDQLVIIIIIADSATATSAPGRPTGPAPAVTLPG